jgi:hypothetical protein
MANTRFKVPPAGAADVEYNKSSGAGTADDPKVMAISLNDLTAANTARTAATPVMPVQIVDAAGNVLSSQAKKKFVSASMSRKVADTTLYTTQDCWGAYLDVTGATNASPIVITCGTHGLADGDPVTIAGVGGNTNANGNGFAKVTGQDTTHFALYSDKALATPVAGNSNYTTGGTVAKLFRFPNVVNAVGGTGFVTKVRIFCDDKTCTAALNLQLFHTPPAAILDNAAYGLLWANRTYRSGEICLPALATKDSTTSDSSATIATVNTANSNLPLPFGCDAGDTDLYGMLVVPTGFTPVAGSTIMIALGIEVD